MTALEQFERLLASLSAGERAQAVQRLVQSLLHWFPGIEIDPGICGGEARIVRTRIPVWVLVQARRQGTREAELLESYPTLCAEDLVNAWAYYREHKDEIERQIRDNESV